MNWLTRLVLLLCVAALAGCSSTSFVQNRDRSYLSAKSIPPMRIPPGISSNEIHNSYPVSDREYPGATTAISLVPPGLMDN